MKTLFRIAFRNLFRQKRRNLLLGSAITVGTLVLVLANSFSHGISQTLIDRVISYAAGHASIGFAHEGKIMSQVQRGGAHWAAQIARIPHVKRVDPTMGVMGRAIGLGRADNAILIAINMSENYSTEDSITTADNFPMVQGDWNDLRDTTIENPLILSTAKAKYLNVKMNDVVRVRVQDFSGRFQAARLTVVGIFEPSNIFMEGALFIGLEDMSRLMGLRTEDTPYLYLTIEDPEKNAVAIADSIWKLMAPPLATMEGTLTLRSDSLRSAPAVLAGYRADSLALQALRSRLGDIAGDGNYAYSRRAALVPRALADSLHLQLGDTLRLRYTLRYPAPASDSWSDFRLVVGGIYTPPRELPQNLVLMHEVPFYAQYYEYLPALGSALKLDRQSTWFKALTPEWILLPRARTTDEVALNKREMAQGKYKGTTVMINTMYESASQILQLESALQIITLGAVMVIFLIILIGVVNTLRMTIRERTREIGTLRAIGMQKKDIRTVFLLETGLLALISAVAGTLLSFVAMAVLSSIPIASAGNPLGIILVHGNLVFAPTALSLVFFIVLIVTIALLTAWFPAHRAAQLPAATAMRHYE